MAHIRRCFAVTWWWLVVKREAAESNQFHIFGISRPRPNTDPYGLDALGCEGYTLLSGPQSLSHVFLIQTLGPLHNPGTEGVLWQTRGRGVLIRTSARHSETKQRIDLAPEPSPRRSVTEFRTGLPSLVPPLVALIVHKSGWAYPLGTSLPFERTSHLTAFATILP